MRARFTAAVLAALLAGALPAAATDDVDRTVNDPRITESSGLAVSFLHPGVLWTHNDSGNPPLIFAIGKNGRTDAAIRLAGETNRDWEAITSFTLQGRPYVAVGDIGDNLAAHPSVRIAILPEPTALRSRTIRPQRVVRLIYPGGPRDAETLVSDPRTNRLYIVSKTLLGAEIYEVPSAAWPDTTSGTSAIVKLKKVAATSASLITDGTFLPDGRLVLRGYGTLYVLPNPSQAKNGRLTPLATAALPSQDQGESITNGGNNTLLIGSEGKGEPVLRIPIPADGADGTEIDTGPAPTLSPTPTTTEQDDDSGGLPVLGIGTAVVAVVAIGGAAYALRRR